MVVPLMRDDIHGLVQEVFDKYGAEYVYLEEALTDSIVELLQSTAGVVQEKLMADLQREREVRHALERRCAFLEEELRPYLEADQDDRERDDG